MESKQEKGRPMETVISLAKKPLGSAPDSGGLATLTPAAAKLARASLSPNTRRAYQGALDRLGDYLRKRGRDMAGLTDKRLADYLSSIHEAGASPAAAAIASSGGQSLAGLRDAALIALMSDCLLRVSEAVALDLDAITFESDGTGRLSIRHSKTDQEGQGATLFVGAPTISRIRAWVAGAAIESGPLFRRVRQPPIRYFLLFRAPQSSFRVHHPCLQSPALNPAERHLRFLHT